jgi:beta-galactosidase/beta-glucuronidase
MNYFPTSTFLNLHLVSVLLLSLLISCAPVRKNNSSAPVYKIEKKGEGFVLLQNGKPYFIKGARTIGTQYLELVAGIGGNSIRIGGREKDVEQILSEANRLGLTVLFGLPMASERNGFDYNNQAAVQAQLDTARSMVRKYKTYPAIMMWAIGNEMDYLPGDADFNLKLWDAVNEVARMIHQEDPAHPAITVVGTGGKSKMENMVKMLPDVDALGINTYADIGDVPGWVRQYKLNKPYIITEWGPTGDWQVKKNKWRLPIEETTTEKARVYQTRHEGVIAKDPYCLGGYSFLWTQGRQERTHTWYNLFYDNGEHTEAVDVLQHMWSGKWPQNRAPQIEALYLDNKPLGADILLEQGKNYQARVQATDPNNDALSYEWEIYPENTRFGYAGQGEKRPQPVNHLIQNRQEASITFTAPATSADYRLFVYVRDKGNKIAVANIPFHVE